MEVGIPLHSQAFDRATSKHVLLKVKTQPPCHAVLHGSAIHGHFLPRSRTRDESCHDFFAHGRRSTATRLDAHLLKEATNSSLKNNTKLPRATQNVVGPVHSGNAAMSIPDLLTPQAHGKVGAQNGGEKDRTIVGSREARFKSIIIEGRGCKDVPRGPVPHKYQMKNTPVSPRPPKECQVLYYTWWAKVYSTRYL